MTDDGTIVHRHDWIEDVAARLLWLHPDWPPHHALDQARTMAEGPASDLAPLDAAQGVAGPSKTALASQGDEAAMASPEATECAPAAVTPTDVLVASATGAAVGFATGLASGALSSVTGAVIGAVSGGIALARTADRAADPATRDAPP